MLNTNRKSIMTLVNNTNEWFSEFFDDITANLKKDSISKTPKEK